MKKACAALFLTFTLLTGTSQFCFGQFTDAGGGDHGGADWAPDNYARIGGVHTNIGTFSVGSGMTVRVETYNGGAGGSLEIRANTITVAGTLSAEGCGYPSGNGGAGGQGGCGGGSDQIAGTSGSAGLGGYPGSGGGGGAVWPTICASAGGPGSSAARGGYAVSGGQGDTTTDESLLMGSGGGGGGGGAGGRHQGGGNNLPTLCAPNPNNNYAGGGGGGGGAGGTGGGIIKLYAATTLSVTGQIISQGLATGGDGLPGAQSYARYDCNAPGAGGLWSNSGYMQGGAGGDQNYGGGGNPEYNFGGAGGNGAAGSGGGVLLKGYTVNLSGTINNAGGDSTVNGGTLKIFYVGSNYTAGTYTTGRTYAQSIPGYALTITKTGTGTGTVAGNVGGISCGSTCSANYPSGTTVQLTATPDADSNFIGWGGACSGTGSCAVSMTDTQAVTAQFDWKPGALSVTISPQEARDLSAQWRVDGGAWQNTGATATDLLPGAHIISFKPIDGWAAPQDKEVTILPDQTTNDTGLYLFCYDMTAPVLTCPAYDNDTVYSISWTEITGAARYELERDTSSTFTMNQTIVDNGSDTFHNEAVPAHQKTYFYRVRALNACGVAGPWSDVKTIFVDPISPAPITSTTTSCPAAQTPGSIMAPGTDDDGSFTVSWGGVAGATGYILNRTDSTTLNDYRSVAGTSFAEKDLPTGTYSYKVKSVTVCGENSPYGATATVQVSIPTTTTTSCPALAAPAQPEAPVYITIDGSFTVSWSAVAGAVGYTLERFDAHSFINPETVYHGQDTTFNENSRGSGWWYYRVRAEDSCGNSGPWSATAAVLVNIPSPVANFTDVWEEDSANKAYAPLTVYFFDKSTGPIQSRAWDFGDGGSSIALFPQHTYTAPGDYYPSLTVTGRGGTSTKVRAKKIQVLPAKITADFTASPTEAALGESGTAVTFTNINPSGTAQYSWNFGDGSDILQNNDATVQHTYSRAGLYSVSLTAEESGSRQTRTQADYIAIGQSGNAAEPAGNDRAIIIVGTKANDKMLESSANMGRNAYGVLKERGGYSEATIRYLHPYPSSSIVDAASTLANIESALTDWAVNNADGSTTGDVLIYLVDHGETGRFFVNSLEQLTAEQLDAWLDSMEAKISGRVVIIYEACYSASFIEALKAKSGESKKRVIICSATGQAYIASGGLASFSRYFWNVYLQVPMYAAFQWARNSIALSASWQEPAFLSTFDYDADGSLAPLMAKNFHINQLLLGPDAAEDAVGVPTIGAISPEQILAEGENSANIWVDNVTTNPPTQGKIVRVWAEVLRPEDNTTLARLYPDLPAFDLTALGSGTYEGKITGIDHYGRYEVSVYAMDNNSSLSAPARTVIVRPGGPDMYEDDDNMTDARPIVIDDPMSARHNFHDAEDADFMKFHCLENDNITYEITAAPVDDGSQCDPVLQIYNSSGEPLAEAKDSAGDGERETIGAWKCPADGLYYIKVWDADSGMDAGSLKTKTAYDLSIAHTTLGATAILSGSVLAFDNQVGLENIFVSIPAQGISTMSGPGGGYLLLVPTGQYTVYYNPSADLASLYLPHVETMAFADAGAKNGDIYLQRVSTSGSKTTTSIAGGGRATTTTTTVPAATTTTITIPSITGLCPAQKTLGKDNPKLAQLRAFRDGTLAQSAVGQKLIQMYYNNAESINTALDRRPALRSAARRVLETLAPMMGR